WPVGRQPLGRKDDRPLRQSGRAGRGPTVRFAGAYLLHRGRAPHGWLLVGAWILFSAYAGQHCVPNLVLKLSPQLQRPGYVASSEAIGSVCHAAATVAGGALFDYFQSHAADTAAATYRGSLFILTAGLAMRSFAAVLAAAIREPGAWTLREMLAGR